MDNIEPFSNSDAFFLPKDSSVSLKDGIDIHKLLGGEGVSFEIDELQHLPQSHFPQQSYDWEQLQQQLINDCTRADSDEDEDLTPFERVAKSLKDISGNGGVLKKVLRAGVGPVVPEGATVKVHYNGYLEYSDEPYDSSRLRNQPQRFHLGQGEVIAGWDLGVATMKKSEIARFLIKSEYAFGSMGCPPRIPPEAAILFEIELINFINDKAADDYEELEGSERKQLSLEELIAVTNAQREIGNDLFQQKNYIGAAKKYSKALHILEGARLKDEEEELQWNAAMIKLLLNLSICSLKQGKAKHVITLCKRVLEIDSCNVKATFRMGQAFVQLSEFKKARQQFIKAGHLAPGNTEIRQEIVKLEKKVEQFKSLEKAMCTRMMQSTSDPMPPPLEGSDPSPEQEGIRSLFHEKLMEFMKNPAMEELVIPSGITEEELVCLKELCQDLGLTIPQGNQKSGESIRVVKPSDAP